MLIIGHRGAAGLAPENTIQSLNAGIKAGSDMLEFDVRLTRDKIPVLVHDFSAIRTHRSASLISRLTLKELNDRFSDSPLPTLESVLDEFFKKIPLNIELKGRGSANAVIELLQQKYINQTSDWEHILISSFQGSEIFSARRLSGDARLGMLHKRNPFLFISYQRQVQLVAVGFHYMHMSKLAIFIAKHLGLMTYAYTINSPQDAKLCQEAGLSAVVSDHPDRIRKFLEN